jgi:hypothetical protein
MAEDAISEVLERLTKACDSAERLYRLSSFEVDVKDLRALLNHITPQGGGEDKYSRPELPSADAGTHIPRSPLGWRPIESAPRDGSWILAQLGDLTDDRWSHLSGRCFVIRHEGATPSDYDLGWSLFPGFGGVSDIWFAGWAPLPEAPSLMAARDMGLSRAPQGADDASGIDPNNPTPQGNRPSREEVARVLFDCERERSDLTDRVICMAAGRPLKYSMARDWTNADEHDREAYLTDADAILSLFPTQPDHAPGEGETPPDGFVPIETAPRDGTRFPAWPAFIEVTPDCIEAQVVEAYWYRHPSVQRWVTDAFDCGDYDFEPTHWLPTQPQTEGGAA